MSSDPNLPPSYERDPSLPPDTSNTTLAPNAGQPTGTGLTPNVAAGLSVVLTLVSGVIFFLLEKRDQFVRLWAMQAIFFGAAWLIESVVAQVIYMVLYRIPLIGWLWAFIMGLITLGFVLVWLFMMFKAFTGKTWELPVLGKMARDQLGRSPRL